MTVLVVAVCMCAMLVGCAPGAGNEQPLSVTVKNGGFVFHWCGPDREPYEYLELGYAEYSPERIDHDAFRGEGEFSLEPATEFGVSDPPTGVAPLLQEEIPVEDDRMILFVYTGSSAEDLDGVWASYNLSRASDLEGRWLYPDGTINDLPCEMRGAVTG